MPCYIITLLCTCTLLNIVSRLLDLTASEKVHFQISFELEEKLKIITFVAIALCPNLTAGWSN